MADMEENDIMEQDGDEGSPLSLGGMMNFFAEQALYRGIAAVDTGDYSGALHDFHMSGADESDGGAMEAEWTDEERKNEELAARWIRSILLFTSEELYDKAESDLDRVLEIKPDFVSGFKNRACIRDAVGKHESALADCDMALQLATSQGRVDADIHYNKGVVLDSLKRYQEAIEQYNQALAIEPETAKHYNNRGYAKQQLDMYDDAISDYTRCLDLSEEFIPTPYINRTRCFEKLSKHKEAIEGWTTLMLKVGDPWTLIQRAKVKIMTGDTDGARSDLFSALEAADCDVKEAADDEWQFAEECRNMLRSIGFELDTKSST